MAAVRLAVDAPNTKHVWGIWGASGVAGVDSDPTLLTADYTGSDGNGPETDLQDAQTYSRLSSSRSPGDGAISWRDTVPGAAVHSIEINLAYELRHTYGIANTAFIVHGSGGTSLNDDWINGAVLSNALTRAQSELTTIGTAYDVRGLILHIAALDADQQPDADNYLTNLGLVAAAFRAVWSDASIILVRPSILLSGDGAAIVHAAVNTFVAGDANSIGINVDDLPFDDEPHWFTPKLETIGERVAYGCSRLLYQPRKGGVVVF